MKQDAIDEYIKRYQSIYRRIIDCYYDAYIIDYINREAGGNRTNRFDTELLWHIMQTQKKDLCLGIWCVCYDNDNDANSLPMLKKHLREEGIESVFKKPKCMKEQEKTITNARKTYIAHWGFQPSEDVIEFSVLISVLDGARDWLNDMCLEKIDGVETHLKEINNHVINILQTKERMITILSSFPHGGSSE